MSEQGWAESALTQAEEKIDRLETLAADQHAMLKRLCENFGRNMSDTEYSDLRRFIKRTREEMV